VFSLNARTDSLTCLLSGQFAYSVIRDIKMLFVLKNAWPGVKFMEMPFAAMILIFYDGSSSLLWSIYII
jgi:hypothetical protein